MKKPLFWSVGLLFAVLAAAIGLWGLFYDPLAGLPAPSSTVESTVDRAPSFKKPERSQRPHGVYAGSAACQECHAEIFDAYTSHPMWRSTRSLAEALPVESYGPENGFHHAGEFYFAEAMDGQFVHHIVRKDDAGEVLYDQQARVTYEIGAGNRGRAYLIPHQDLLFQSALTWYSGKQGWGLSPGYTGQNRRFERRIVDGCVTCHVGRMNRPDEASDRYDTNPIIEPGIGCERCHGPGSDHIAWHASNEVPPGKDPIVNPEKLDPPLRESVCQQCHLTGVDRVVRYGRTEFDFRPGDHLTDIWMPFIFEDQGSFSSPVMAVSHVEQIASSQCAIHTGPSFGCLSCHDPHQTPAAEERVSYYRQRCLKCHALSGTECSLPEATRRMSQPEDSCIACHMPAVDADDVPHTAQTDHRILKSPPAPQKGKSPRASQRIVLTPEARSLTPEWAQQRAEGIMMTRRADQTSDSVLALEALNKIRPLVRVLDDDLLLWVAYADALQMAQLSGEAHEVWMRILEMDPENEAALEGLAFAYHDSGRYELGLKYLDRLIAINSFRSEYFGRRAHILGQLRRFDEALESAHKARNLNPSNPTIYAWLSEVYQTLGEAQKARHYQELFQKLTSTSPK